MTRQLARRRNTACVGAEGSEVDRRHDPAIGVRPVSWFLTPLGRGDTSYSQGSLIWSEDPAFGFRAESLVKGLVGSGPWLVGLECRGEGGDHCNHGVLICFSWEPLPWIVSIDPRPMSIRQLWRVRGDTSAPGGRICRVPVAKVPGADIHPQCVLARVGSAPIYPSLNSWRW